MIANHVFKPTAEEAARIIHALTHVFLQLQVRNGCSRSMAVPEVRMHRERSWRDQSVRRLLVFVLRREHPPLQPRNVRAMWLHRVLQGGYFLGLQAS